MMTKSTPRDRLLALFTASALLTSVALLAVAPASAAPSSSGAATTIPTNSTPSATGTWSPSKGPTASSTSTSRATSTSATSPSITPSSTTPSSTAPSGTTPSGTSATHLGTTPQSSTTAANAQAKAATTPDLVKAVHYLVTTTGANGDTGGTSLSKDGYYESFPAFADFGLTIDGAFALAATGTADPDLRTVVDFLRLNHADASDRTVDDWTGIGTTYASGGSIGKEAVLAEVAGYDPRSFGGHDLIAALASLVCKAGTAPPDYSCAGVGNYSYAASVFSQSLGVIAQVRAGDTADAAAPITYLEGLQNQAGAWPSLIPGSGDSDVDSTAMAAMALALLPTDPAAKAAVTKAEQWLAAHQTSDGGFTGTVGDSTNSAALAIQGLSLAGTTYAAQIAKARAFLAGQQNSDGGFNVAAGGQVGSDIRASTQIVGGIVGTSFGTLTDDIAGAPAPPTSPPSTTATTRSTATTTAIPTTTSVTSSTTSQAGSVGSPPSAPGAGVQSTTTTGVLASTGLRTTGLLALAMLLLIAGGALVVVGRRRGHLDAGHLDAGHLDAGRHR